MIGANYIVKILPNKLILVRNNETKESKVLKPRELAAFFDEQLADQIKEWEKNDESFVKIESELSKL